MKFKKYKSISDNLGYDEPVQMLEAHGITVRGFAASIERGSADKALKLLMLDHYGVDAFALAEILSKMPQSGN